MKASLHKQAMLTAEALRELLSYDPANGEFRWKRSRARTGMVAGVVRCNGYRVIVIGKLQFLAHRLAWLYMTGGWPLMAVDHRNGDRDDNRWHNLREASTGENLQNQRHAHKRNVGGVLGVSWCAERDNWRAMIMVNGKRHFLGRYKNKDDAEQAYLRAKVDLHPFQTIQESSK